jgi:uncharacterized protein YodC (DUF2158 family)
MRIERGDVVRLKSGGPKMTVKFICSDTEVCCFWFSPSVLIGFDLKEDWFNVDQLKLVDRMRNTGLLTHFVSNDVLKFVKSLRLSDEKWLKYSESGKKPDRGNEK